MNQSDIAAEWSKLTPYFLSVLRIAAALLFMEVGAMKLFAFPMGMPPGAALTPLLWTAGVLEVFGGALMLLGLFTRPVAFILSGEMAVAYFIGHFPNGFWPILNGGTDAIFYCFLWLYFSAAGAGAWSVDKLRRRSL